MVETKVDASELKRSEEKKLIEKLADFLKEKTGGEVITESEVVTIKGEGKAVGKNYVRVTIKKFLHKHELKENFRVIAGEESMIRIKERNLEEED